MSTELIVTIGLIFFVLLSVVAGVASLYLLKIANDRNKAEHESEQPKARDRENLVAPAQRETNIESFRSNIEPFMSNVNTGSLAPEDMRNRAIAAAQAWQHVMPPLISYEEWQQAVEASGVFDNIQMTQGTLDLTVSHIDYTQLISRTTPEDIEDLFRAAERYSRST